MASIQASNRAKGDRFEEEIADLYSAMGYEVSRHVGIAGQEVDILATLRVPGSGPYTLIVECKFRSSSALLSNEDVQSIAGAFHIARGANSVHACVIVTTNGFSLPAQEAARAAGIVLTTKRELSRGLIDFSPYLNELEAR